MEMAFKSGLLDGRINRTMRINVQGSTDRFLIDYSFPYSATFPLISRSNHLPGALDIFGGEGQPIAESADDSIKVKNIGERGEGEREREREETSGSGTTCIFQHADR